MRSRLGKIKTMDLELCIKRESYQGGHDDVRGHCEVRGHCSQI